MTGFRLHPTFILLILFHGQVNWTAGKDIILNEPAKEPYKITCPDPKRIAPCTCTIRNSESKVECRGEQITQEVINLTLMTLRQLNNLKEDPSTPLHISKLKIQSTKMKEFNLTPLINCRFKSLSITFNENLTKIFGPPLKTFEITSPASPPNYNVTDKIQTDELHLESNNLTDKGLLTTFYYFQSNLIKLTLFRNKLLGSHATGDFVEFLPGFSTLSNLQKLDLSRNKILKINGGQFKSNVKLQEINLQWNEIAELGQNAFLLNDPSNSEITPLNIDLTANILSDERIHSDWLPLSSDYNKNKIIRVNFSHNKFEFISYKNFQKFLSANPENSLVFCDSFHCEPRTIRCDARMKWVKENRKYFEHRLSGLNCTNDRRHTVFTSKLTDVVPAEYSLLCPRPDLIAPCVCEPGHLKIDCRGEAVTQEVINVVIGESQKLNLPKEPRLVFHTFTIRRTNLTELDLTRFLGIRFENLAIIKNPNLTKIFVADSPTIPLPTNETAVLNDEKIELLIEANYLGLNDNSFMDEGLGQIFKRFSAKTLTALNLQNNGIRGSTSVHQFVFGGGLVLTKNAGVSMKEVEFLPGFSSMNQLEFLVLSNNKISKISGGQFKGLSNLRMLDLGHNEVENVGADAFVLNGGEELEGKTKVQDTLIINMRYNKLRDELISTANGLDTSDRPTVVDFSGNKFDSISKENFKSFLGKNPLNCMYFYFTGFVCDVRLKWVKDERSDLEHRVTPLNCANDPGHTAFTSNKIF